MLDDAQTSVMNGGKMPFVGSGSHIGIRRTGPVVLPLHVKCRRSFPYSLKPLYLRPSASGSSLEVVCGKELYAFATTKPRYSVTPFPETFKVSVSSIQSGKEAAENEHRHILCLADTDSTVVAQQSCSAAEDCLLSSRPEKKFPGLCDEGADDATSFSKKKFSSGANCTAQQRLVELAAKRRNRQHLVIQPESNVPDVGEPKKNRQRTSSLAGSVPNVDTPPSCSRESKDLYPFFCLHKRGGRRVSLKASASAAESARLHQTASDPSETSKADEHLRSYLRMLCRSLGSVECNFIFSAFAKQHLKHMEGGQLLEFYCILVQDTVCLTNWLSGKSASCFEDAAQAKTSSSSSLPLSVEQNSISTIRSHNHVSPQIGETTLANPPRSKAEAHRHTVDSKQSCARREVMEAILRFVRQLHPMRLTDMPSISSASSA